MRHYFVAPESYGAENIEDGEVIEAVSDYEAAEAYVGKNFADLDYPDETKVLVQEAGTNELTRWDVFSYRTYTFCAYKEKP